jgi:hypothetical protein
MTETPSKSEIAPSAARLRMVYRPSDIASGRAILDRGGRTLEAHRVERKLSAIFAADVEGYSRSMEQDEVGTLRTLTAYRAIILNPAVDAGHGGNLRPELQP